VLEKVLGLGIDRVLLDALYRDRLRGLRNRAEEAGLSKSGSVEVVRARLIQHHILGDDDLSWEGIQSMTHKEIGEVLKVFGIKSSGSHKESRQRLWLHLNFDSRRLTVERLADRSREDSVDLLDRLCRQADYPEYQCRFSWAPGSIAFWDNRAVQHYANSDYWPAVRIMERASIIGDRPTA